DPFSIATLRSRYRNVVKQFLVAARHRRPHSFPLGRFAPVRRRRHCPRIGAETRRDAILAMLLPDKLPEIPLSGLTHLRGTRVAEMRIMRPDHYLRVVLG